MNQPLVSVVMAVYNSENYLHQAIDSVLNQSYKNLELLVINDGSTDSSRNIILSIDDIRIRYFENEGNKGIVKTRNLGIENSNGKYIAILDSDDIAMPEKLMKQVDFLERNQDFGLCASYFNIIDKNDVIQGKVKRPKNDHDAIAHLIVENCICHSSVIFPASILRQHEYSEEFIYNEDYELIYRISKISKIKIITECLTSYRVHSNNTSVKKRDERFNILLKLNRLILQDIGINFTEQELLLHSNFILYNHDFFSDESKIEDLEKWIFRFIENISANPNYKSKLVIEILIEKWFVICFKSGNYGRLIKNRLFRNELSVYMKALLKKFIKTSQDGLIPV